MLDVHKTWLVIRIWLGCGVVILLTNLILHILNLLPTIHFKWSIRITSLLKWIWIGCAVYLYFLFKEHGYI